MNQKPTFEIASEEKKSKKKLFIILGIVSVILVIGLYYFIKSANYESTDNAQLDADIVPIKSSIAGYIKAIKFKDNQLVKKGDTLVLIDATDFKTRVAQAEATLENAKANLLATRSNASASGNNASASSFSSSSVQQSINSAKARFVKVQADFKRGENMFAAKAATQAQLDAAKAELDIAQAQVDAAIGQYKSATEQAQGIHSQAEAQRAQVVLAEALVKQREAELNLAKSQLLNTMILSPCTGIVTKRSIEVGQYITVAQPLCSTIDNSHIWITANFKETQVKKIKVGQEVKIKLDAFPDIELKGKVDSYIGATGAKFSLLPPDNSTGNFVKITQRVPVRIELSDVQTQAKEILYPGLSAFVEIKVN
mgnify:CR=1 FL=1